MASGGATELADLEALMGLVADGVEGAIIGTALYEGRFTLRGRPGADSAMSLAVRVIPCLDVDAGRVVKGINFKELRDAGDPVELARIYDAEGADELTFLDISASHEGRATTMEIVSRTAEEVFIPLTVGGGDVVGRRRRPPAPRGRGQGRGQHRRHQAARAGGRDRGPFGNQVLVLSVDAAAHPARRPGLGSDNARRPGVRRAGRDRVGGPSRPSSAPARFCSMPWTPMAPRTASTST